MINIAVTGMVVAKNMNIVCLGNLGN